MPKVMISSMERFKVYQWVEKLKQKDIDANKMTFDKLMTLCKGETGTAFGNAFFRKALGNFKIKPVSVVGEKSNFFSEFHSMKEKVKLLEERVAMLENSQRAIGV